jgi:lipopolysaccharide/colanic/teichoic acid biosynthesis glycosyltransferase
MGEKIFTMYKFRTMSNKVNSEGKLLPDEERRTKLGSFLRSSCLDELPELINILKGDLAIVGPRPLLPEYIPYYTERERLRHNVRGGLTQPEVLHNKILPTWDEQLEYEADYSEKLSFSLDLRIVFRTLKIIIWRMKGNYGSCVRMSLVEERRSQTVKSIEYEVKMK